MPHTQISLQTISAPRQEILAANRLHHAYEAEVYDTHHGEIFNCYAQFKMKRVLSSCVRTLAGLLNNRTLRVLDCACGTGNLSEKLLKHDVLVDAIDISPEMLAKLRQKLNDSGRHKCRTIATDIDSFIASAADNSYDFVTFSSALHHLPDYVETLKNTIRMVSRPGIVLIFHEPLAVEAAYVNPLSQRLKSLDRFVWKYWGKLTRRRSYSHAQTNQIDADLVDFHVRRGGVQPDRLTEIIEAHHGQVLEYVATSENMRHCWSAWIDNFFALRKDNFHLVALFK